MQVVDSEGYLKVKLVGGPVGPFVPYTGATANVDLGEYEIKAGQFTLDTSPTGTAVVGTTRWNNNIGSSETTLKGGSVILKNGVDLVARVVNKVTPNTTLTKAGYAAVRVSGAQGQRLAVAYAQADSDANSADTIGLVTETIATNQEGFIITVGQLEGVNTTGSLQGETWVDGSVLYLSPTIPGALTNIKPNGLTGHIIVIGYVEYAHAINGKIYVKIMNGWELDELHNVYINPATIANNNILQYDSADQLWKNQVLNTGITIGTTLITSGTVGRVLFEGTGNVVQESANLFWDNTNGRLGIGTSSPSQALQVVGGAVFSSSINISGGFVMSEAGNVHTFTAPATNRTIRFITNSQSYSLFSTGNFAINTTTDAGFKLDVNGTARVQGQLSVTSNIVISAGSGITAPFFNGTVNNFQFGIAAIFGTQTNSVAVASGLRSAFLDTIGWQQSSGTAEFASFRATPTYNTTGTYSGIVRGFHYNPVITSLTGATHRAIETTSGDVIFNGGNVGIGTSSPVVKYHQSQTQGILARYDVTNANADQNRGVWEFYTNTAVTPDFFGRFGFKFEGGINNASRQFQLHVSDNTNPRFVVNGSGNVLINTTTDAGFRLDVNGTARFTGAVTTPSAVFSDSSGTSRITLVGAGGGLIGTNCYLGTNAILGFNLTTSAIGSVSIGGNFNAVASAILDIRSTTKGFLPPRMDTTQKNAIASPAAGLQIFDTTLNRPCFYDGTTWITL